MSLVEKELIMHARTVAYDSALARVRLFCLQIESANDLTSSICWLISDCAASARWLAAFSSVKLPGTIRTLSLPTAESRAISVNHIKKREEKINIFVIHFGFWMIQITRKWIHLVISIYSDVWRICYILVPVDDGVCTRLTHNALFLPKFTVAHAKIYFGFWMNRHWTVLMRWVFGRSEAKSLPLYNLLVTTTRQI